MGKCHKGDDRVVIGRGMNVKHKVDDQTIIDNCQISKMKIGSVESINGGYLE